MSIGNHRSWSLLKLFLKTPHHKNVLLTIHNPSKLGKPAQRQKIPRYYGRNNKGVSYKSILNPDCRAMKQYRHMRIFKKTFNNDQAQQ